MIIFLVTKYIETQSQLKYYILLFISKTMMKYILKAGGNYLSGMMIINHQDFLNDDTFLYTFSKDFFVCLKDQVHDPL